MDRWSGILKVPLGRNQCRVAASLCVSPSSKNLIVPKVNAIFFNGDRVEGTGNTVIDKLSDLQNIAQVIVAKFGGSVNAWVVEASTFNGPFVVYKDFISSLNKWGEPQAYTPHGFPASTSVVSLLSNFCSESDLSVSLDTHQENIASAASCVPKTVILGFSKGGVVLNQLVTELGFLNTKGMAVPPQPILSKFPPSHILPSSTENFLDSITEIHYVDVGLNAPGAYLTNDSAIERISEGLIQRDRRMRVVLHGTPRQWNDSRRAWIYEEKNKLRQLLELGTKKSNGRLEVSERTYFSDRPSDLQMHFQIIEEMIVT